MIEVNYKFRVSETNTDEMGARKIVYKIDTKTGEPGMMAVVKVE